MTAVETGAPTTDPETDAKAPHPPPAAAAALKVEANGTADVGLATASEPGPGIDRGAGSTRFAHPSEAEFARVLDFYQVCWQYEP